MKRILTTLCAVVMAMTCAVPALAAGENPSAFYPIKVEEYLEGESPRIRKVYQLALSDDPAQIPTEDFERDGRLYFLLDMTREDSVGVVTRPHIETITAKSDTNDIQKVLAQLDAEIDVATEDAYTGTLRLDHTSVKVTADGYATKTKSLAATRTYPNLSEADLSLIPKTIEENGKTLELADVKWDSSLQTAAEGTVTRYSATASYAGTSSYQYATGYTVTANYSGNVARTDCETVTYTAIFGSMPIPEEQAATEDPTGETPAGEDNAADAAEPAETKPLVIGTVVLAIAVGGVFAVKKFKERR